MVLVTISIYFLMYFMLSSSIEHKQYILSSIFVLASIGSLRAFTIALVNCPLSFFVIIIKSQLIHYLTLIVMIFNFLTDGYFESIKYTINVFTADILQQQLLKTFLATTWTLLDNPATAAKFFGCCSGVEQAEGALAMQFTTQRCLVIHLSTGQIQ